MAEPITIELSHEEALELLPWLVNASLNDHLSRQVADHVEGCAICQHESAILSSTIMAFNTSEPDYQDVDSRFQNLMHRIREQEQQRNSAASEAAQGSLGATLKSWLAIAPNRQQWAVAFSFGLIVGIGALMTADYWTDSRFDDDYVVLSGQDSALRIQVQFVEPPESGVMDKLQEEYGTELRWQRLSGKEYVIVFPDDTSVANVSAVRAALLSEGLVENVRIDLR